MKFGLIAALSAFFVAGPALAQEWVAVSANDDKVLGLDQASVRRSGGQATAWTITTFKATKSFDGETYFDYVVTREVFDCEQDRSRSLAIRSFLLDNDDPTVVINETGDWSFHQPGSMGGELLAYACGDPERVEAFASAAEFSANAQRVLNDAN